jgi:hypothetical protein
MIACVQNKNYINFTQDCMANTQSSFMKYLISFLTFFVLVAGCSSIPKSSPEDALLDPLTRYTKAADALEQAAQLAPTDESISLPLAEAHFNAAESAFNQAEANTSFDPRTTINLYRTARDHAEKSMAALRSILSRPNEGPGMMDQLLRQIKSRYTLHTRVVLHLF